MLLEINTLVGPSQDSSTLEAEAGRLPQDCLYRVSSRPVRTMQRDYFNNNQSTRDVAKLLA